MTMGTHIHDIDNGKMVGKYYDSSYRYKGFYYDGTNWTSLVYPGANRTIASGIQGNLIVGNYAFNGSGSGDGHGFIYDGTTWESFDFAGAVRTSFNHIDGDTIVGSYVDAQGRDHGLIYIIPEPATLSLLGIGFLIVRKKRPIH